MILDSVTLTNFGVYTGTHQIELTPSVGRPVILFGGLNGGGKTTLLDAIQLAFYGSNARCASRGRAAYKDFLRSSISRSVSPAEGASVSVRFRKNQDGETKTYELTRRWQENGNGTRETVSVRSEGEYDPILTEFWSEFVEGYIPSAISHLFFFDAEQIKDLAEGRNAAELLGTAIHSLLGLGVVDRLEADLRTVERRKRSLIKPVGRGRQIADAERELALLDKLQADATSARASAATELDQLAKQLRQIEQKFEAEGGNAFIEHSKRTEEITRVSNEVAVEEQRLREASAGALPLLQIPDLLTAVALEVKASTEIDEARRVIDTLEVRDDKILNALSNNGLSARHLQAVGHAFQVDLSERKELAKRPMTLPPIDGLSAKVHHLHQDVLPAARVQALQLVEKLGRAREKLARLQMALTRVPAVDAVAALQLQLETIRAAHGKQAGEVEALDAKLTAITRQRQDADAAVSRAIRDSADILFAGEDGARIVRHAAKVRHTLQSFRAVTIERHAARIERLMLEGFAQLLRKSTLIGGIRVDPETFAITLKSSDGIALPLEQLSAGERQLLATSLLWALARASGRAIPTIIDTPLGRLDSSHRRHLVDRYFPVASHQVILLSTDEEIDEETYRRLTPYISRKYELKYDDVTKSTQVVPGYFWS